MGGAPVPEEFKMVDKPRGVLLHATFKQRLNVTELSSSNSQEDAVN